MTPTTLRLRKGVAIANTAVGPVLITFALFLMFGFSWQGALFVALFGAVQSLLWAHNYRKVRRRTLQIDETGGVVQRDDFRLRFTWDQVRQVQHRREYGLVGVDELIIEEATIEPIDSKGQPTRPTILTKLESHPATGRVMVNLYDKDWRSGPIGTILSKHGVALEAAAD